MLGQKLGEMHLISNDEIISSINLIAKTDVRKISFWNMTSHVFEKWFSLLRF